MARPPNAACACHITLFFAVGCGTGSISRSDGMESSAKPHADAELGTDATMGRSRGPNEVISEAGDATCDAPSTHAPADDRSDGPGSDPNCVADCTRCAVCEDDGRCSPDGDACVAVSDDDCHMSYRACWVEGRCTASDGNCIVSSTADCVASLQCPDLGKCTFASGACIAGGNADCRPSAACYRTGKCDAVCGECVALTDDDCLRSSGCVDEGFCAAAGGQCIATVEGCAASKLCYDRAHCTPLDGVCTLVTDDDCVVSGQCEHQGRCRFLGTQCHTFANTNEECQAMEECSELGWCVSLDGVCGAGSQQDCDGLPVGAHAYLQQQAECTLIR